MFNFLVGSVFGFCVATYGVMGVATAFENTINTAKTVKVTTENK
jgi:hypothetical protein